MTSSTSTSGNPASDPGGQRRAPLPEAELHRTARQMNLPGFGLEQQQRLHDTHVLVVGAGGLGCPAMQQLAAVGVGTMTVIDDDIVDLTNIHRQILFGAEDVGRAKADLAAERIRALQPGIRVTALQERLTVENAVELVSQADIVLDGSDNFATKYLVADAAEITGTPLVWGTVLRFSGQAALWISGQDSRGVGLRDLFPTQPGAGFVDDCATAGVLGVTTSVVAGLMATELIKHVAGLGATAGRVLNYEALSATLTPLQVTADPTRELVTHLGEYEQACDARGGFSAGSMERKADQSERQRLLELIRDGKATALDIREPHEVILTPWTAAGEDRVEQPLSAIATCDDVPGVGAAAVPTDGHPTGDEHEAKVLVVACASGVRSARFVEAFGAELRTRGITAVSFPGGVGL